jgi:flagellar hook-length control protein FliK
MEVLPTLIGIPPTFPAPPAPEAEPACFAALLTGLMAEQSAGTEVDGEDDAPAAMVETGMLTVAAIPSDAISLTPATASAAMHDSPATRPDDAKPSDAASDVDTASTPSHVTVSSTEASTATHATAPGKEAAELPAAPGSISSAPPPSAGATPGRAERRAPPEAAIPRTTALNDAVPIIATNAAPHENEPPTGSDHEWTPERRSAGQAPALPTKPAASAPSVMTRVADGEPDLPHTHPLTPGPRSAPAAREAVAPAAHQVAPAAASPSAGSRIIAAPQQPSQSAEKPIAWAASSTEADSSQSAEQAGRPLSSASVLIEMPPGPAETKADHAGPRRHEATASETNPAAVPMRVDIALNGALDSGHTAPPAIPGSAAPGWAPQQPAGHALPPIMTAARQVTPFAVSLALGSDDRTSLVLEPAELGRVEVAIERNGTEAHVTVRVERPETLALLQRDRPELERALSNIGLAGSSDGRGPSLSFGLGGEGAAGRERRQSGGTARGRISRPAAAGAAHPSRPLSLIDLAI